MLRECFQEFCSPDGKILFKVIFVFFQWEKILINLCDAHTVQENLFYFKLKMKQQQTTTRMP